MGFFNCLFFSLFQSVNAKYFGFIKSIGSVGTNWRLCKRTWSSHANGIWTRFLSNRQFYAGHQSSTTNCNATSSLLEMSHHCQRIYAPFELYSQQTKHCTQRMIIGLRLYICFVSPLLYFQLVSYTLLSTHFFLVISLIYSKIFEKTKIKNIIMIIFKVPLAEQNLIYINIRSIVKINQYQKLKLLLINC